MFQGYNAMNARDLEEGWDVVIVHDPQPAGLFNNASEKSRHWVWRCHIDLSTPNPSTIERLRPLIEPYEASVWHLPQYVPEGITDGVRIVPPAIDPLSPKNMAFSPEDAAFVSEQFGIDPERPLLCQVSRFDPWKDPMGVIDAYRAVREKVPDVQLALVGSMATDDPEGWDFFNRTMAHADGDPDIKILSNLNNVGAIEVNAFQSQADVCIQKSTREGFGLTVTEALWKGRPTIGGDVGGIPLQIVDGESGFLVSSVARSAPSGASRSSRTPIWPSGSGKQARSMRGRTSSAPGSFATGSRSSPRSTYRSLSDASRESKQVSVVVSL